MDKAIERKSWTLSRALITVFSITAVCGLLFLVIDSPGASTMKVDPDRITVGVIHQGEFMESVPILGTVEPIKTVFLDAVEGGRIEEILVEDGEPITAGTLILRLSNAALQKESISTESRLLENINTLRNTRINLAEKELLLKGELLDTSYRIQQLQKKFDRYEQMNADEKNTISQSEFEAVVDELVYLQERKKIVQARIVQEKSLREQQLAQVNSTIKRVERDLAIVEMTLQNLEVRAPIDGFLSTLRVEIGQSINRGENIGQIDVLDSFKIRAQIDQYYISRVSLNQVGEVDINSIPQRLRVDKIYPEVTNDIFEADLSFTSPIPTDIKRGQSLRINLNFGSASNSLLIGRGGFFRSTGGRWVFQLSEDGSRAFRKEVRIGRQNPDFFELLGGLKAGERIITSSYENFSDAQEIEFTRQL